MAENNNFNGVVDSLMKGMDTVLAAKTVVGEPTRIGDTIIVPLVDVSFGVGAGASAADRKSRGSGADSNNGKNGAGGGFAGKMSPSAVLVIQNGSTKLVNVKNQDALTKVLDMIPDLVDKFTKPKDMIKDEDALDIAFPDEA